MNGLGTLVQIGNLYGLAGLQLAIMAGLSAGLLAAAVLLINLLFRRWLTAGQLGLLWGLVLLRLAVPFAPPGAVSLQNLFAETPTDPVVQNAALRAAMLADDSAGYSTPANAGSVPAAQDHGLLWSRILTEALPVAWLCGAILVLVWTALVNWRFSRQVKRTPVCQEESLLRLWETCRHQVGMRRAIPITLFDCVQQPAVMGLFRPRLLLPIHVTELDDDQLRMIMLHELAHVRRWDIAVNWAMVLLRAIHWWNPVYWLAAARCSSLRELACDAFVVRRCEGQPIRGYSELLLTLAARQSGASPWRVMLPASILGFVSSFFRKRTVGNRLKALRRAGATRSRWQTVGVAAAIGFVAACGLTDAKPPQKSRSPNWSDWLPPATIERVNAWATGYETYQGPLVTRVYDLSKALHRVAQDSRTSADAQTQLEYLISFELTRPQGQPAHLVADIGAGGSATSPPAESKTVYELKDRKLTVTAPAARHDELAREILAWEQSGLGQISVECRILDSDRDWATAAGIGWRYLEAFSRGSEEAPLSEANGAGPVVRATSGVEDYLPIVSANLNQHQAKALVNAIQGDRRSNVLQAPKVTCFSGQKVLISDVTQTPFVVGVREVDATGTKHLPKIDVIDEGLRLTLRPLLSKVHARVQLSGRVELSEIGEVSEVAALHQGEPVTIQIPRVQRCHIDIASDVNDGDSLLIGCLPHFERKRFFFLLLTVRTVSEPANAGL